MKEGEGKGKGRRGSGGEIREKELRGGLREGESKRGGNLREGLERDREGEEECKKGMLSGKEGRGRKGRD